MKKYIFTSPKFIGNVDFWYNEAGFMVYYHNQAEMRDDQHKWMLKNLPRVEEEIEPLSKVLEGSLEVLPEDLSFDRFWNEYGKKINKDRCIPMWGKMSPANRLICLKSISPYKKYLERTGFRSMADPENYLKKGSYKNDWKNER